MFLFAAFAGGDIANTITGPIRGIETVIDAFPER
jgi:hypothetical protein